jgi:hypothetical protein
MQWPERLKNGELLKAAEEASFQVMVTCDQNIRYQQNLTGRKLALVALGSQRLNHLSRAWRKRRNPDFVPPMLAVRVLAGATRYPYHVDKQRDQSAAIYS